MKCQYCKKNEMRLTGHNSYMLTDKQIRVCDDCNELETQKRIENYINRKKEK